MPSMDELLLQTSRTFALAIPLLPEPTRHTTCLAYLLFRIADTFEDAGAWDPVVRQGALTEFAALLRAPTPEKAAALREHCLTHGPTAHAGDLALLRALPEVFGEVARLDLRARDIVLEHAWRTADGMRQVLGHADASGWLRVTTLQGLRDYCYVVAGIVGELLSALFLSDVPGLSKVADRLHAFERDFGEGLQLVNILKDEQTDDGEGRCYLPPHVPRAELFALARRDLQAARAYIAALREGFAPPGFIAFTALSQELAEATLTRLESHGPGAKIPRTEVFAILERVQREALQ